MPQELKIALTFRMNMIIQSIFIKQKNKQNQTLEFCLQFRQAEVNIGHQCRGILP